MKGVTILNIMKIKESAKFGHNTKKLGSSQIAQAMFLMQMMTVSLILYIVYEFMINAVTWSIKYSIILTWGTTGLGVDPCI